MLQVAEEAAETLELWGLWFSLFSSQLHYNSMSSFLFLLLSLCLISFHFSFLYLTLKTVGVTRCLLPLLLPLFSFILVFCSLSPAKCLCWPVSCLWTGTTNYSMIEQHLAQFLVTLLALQDYKSVSNCKSIERNYTTSHSILFLNVFNCFWIFTENQVIRII